MDSVSSKEDIPTVFLLSGNVERRRVLVLISARGKPSGPRADFERSKRALWPSARSLPSMLKYYAYFYIKCLRMSTRFLSPTLSLTAQREMLAEHAVESEDVAVAKSRTSRIVPTEIVHQIVWLVVASFVDDLIAGHLAPPKEIPDIMVCLHDYHGLLDGKKLT